MLSRRVSLLGLLPLALAFGCGEGPSSSTDSVEPDIADSAEVTSDAGPESPDGTRYHDTADTLADTHESSSPPSWEPPPAPRASSPSPLLLELISASGLAPDVLGFRPDDYAHSSYESSGALADPFRLARFRTDQASPLAIPALGHELGASFDALTTSAHPIASAIRRAALRLDRFRDIPPPAALTPADPIAALTEALHRACDAANRPCPDLAHPFDDALSEGLLPVFSAMIDAQQAASAMAALAPYVPLSVWIEHGGFAISNVGQLQLLRKSSVRDHALGLDTLPALNLAAARLAWALDELDLNDIPLSPVDLRTPLGRIVIGTLGPDRYERTTLEDPIWLFLDPGGDDTYLGPIGATVLPTAAATALVTVALDLGGDDTYTYDPVADPNDAPGILPSDRFGRFAPDGSNGPITASREARQGAARHGIAMLIDRGAGQDTYRSLAQSQGYAHIGVGVLFDDGGDDTYESEVASQGAAAFGIGLLLDLGGDDTYRVAANGQGMAGVAGYGLLFDGAGDDSYYADPGPDNGGTLLYYSPQMPGQANSSMAQGAATGLRWDSAELWLSGGIGVLRDASGDDHYLAALFAQGSAYWQGTGLLSDGSGSDTYDALWYVQGAGAHYALAMLLDAGPGDDTFNHTLAPVSVGMGSGHDFSLGVLMNAAGADRYRFAGLAIGASNCNGTGLFIDDSGDDTYETTSDFNSGLGNISDECATARPLARSIGLMLDAGGTDTYLYPTSAFTTPTNGGSWGKKTHDLPSEHGAGLDGEGGSGLSID